MNTILVVDDRPDARDSMGRPLAKAGFDVRECRVVAHAWPRYHRALFRLLPRWAFDALARVWARLVLRRQVHAVAVKPAA